MTATTYDDLSCAARQWPQWELDRGDGARLGLFSCRDLDELPPARALALVDQWFPGGLAQFTRNPRRAQHATSGMEMVANLAVRLRHDGVPISALATQFNVPARYVLWWLLVDHARSLLPTRLQTVRRSAQWRAAADAAAQSETASSNEEGLLTW
jgi:hypothetical protein